MARPVCSLCTRTHRSCIYPSRRKRPTRPSHPQQRNGGRKPDGLANIAGDGDGDNPGSSADSGKHRSRHRIAQPYLVADTLDTQDQLVNIMPSPIRDGTHMDRLTNGDVEIMSFLNSAPISDSSAQDHRVIVQRPACRDVESSALPEQDLGLNNSYQRNDFLSPSFFEPTPWDWDPFGSGGDTLVLASPCEIPSRPEPDRSSSAHLGLDSMEKRAQDAWPESATNAGTASTDSPPTFCAADDERSGLHMDLPSDLIEHL